MEIHSVFQGCHENHKTKICAMSQLGRDWGGSQQSLIECSPTQLPECRQSQIFFFLEEAIRTWL